MSTYGWIDLGAVFLPFVLGFHPRLRFHRQWWALAPAIALMMGLFIPWDACFTGAGIWGFGKEQVWHIRLLGLPLEEWFFFVCIPYACVFTYHCFRVLGLRDMLAPYTRTISVALILLGAAVAALNGHKTYTVAAFGGMAVGVAFAAFVWKAPWLGRFYFAYLVLQLPFLLVNGLLTGTALSTPVVWYAPMEHLGLRISTIPVEDACYGLLMLLLTVGFYEALLERRTALAGIPAAR